MADPPAARLAAWLRAAGFPSPPSADALEWITETPSVAALVHRLCELSAITPTERAAFAALPTPLDGADLDAALHALAAASSPLTVDALRGEVATLSRDAEHLAARARVLRAHRDQLVAHHDGALARDQSALTAAADAASSAARNEDVAKIQAHTAALAEALARLRAAAHEYRDLAAEPDAFLHRLECTVYYLEDDAFTRELKQFLQHHFDRTAAAAAAAAAAPDSPLAAPHDTYQQQTQELARLEDALRIAQSTLIDARIRVAEKRAVQAELERHIAAAASGAPPRIDDLRARVQSTEIERNKAHAGLPDLDPLLASVARLQATPVLHTDYNLKLARQQRFAARQDQVIALLRSQQARHRALTLAFDVDRALQQRCMTIMLSAATDLDALAAGAKDRAARYPREGGDARAPPRQRRTVDARDHGGLAVDALLRMSSPDEPPKSVISTASLQERLSALASASTRLDQELEDILDSDLRLLRQDQGARQRLSDILEGHDQRTFGDASRMARESLDQFAAGLNKILQDRARRVEHLRAGGRPLAQERNTFVKFCLEPGALGLPASPKR